MGNVSNVGKGLQAPPSTINACIAHWAEQTQDASALVFLEDGENESGRLTYAQLHQRAGEIAHSLQARNLVGERVLLLFHSGLDYVSAFFGCLYAGVIAVPVYPPRNNYHAERMAAIAQDAQAGTILCSHDLVADIAGKMGQFANSSSLQILAVDGEEMRSDHTWMNHTIQFDALAYLQYTSGSTGLPKGVMVSHLNLLHNCRYSQESLGLPEQSSFVSWLPIFHDLGLVHGICLALTLGGTSVFMPSAVFVQKPIRWLRAIDRYRAVYTPAPNFAYELCTNKVSAAEAASLDLSSWLVGLNGAEPIIFSTLEKFREHFASSGFDPATFSSGYGLAETTLLVTSGKRGERTPVLLIDAEEIKHDRVRILDSTLSPSEKGVKPQVSSGWVAADPQVRIVAIEQGGEIDSKLANDGAGAKRRVCEDGEVGEIWVAGNSNCGGYWRRAEETAEIFGATLSDAPGKTYIRTGDLGFAYQGQLYVTGRLKDLVIIRGANHYPQDLERTAEYAHPALRKGGWAAAFTLDDGLDVTRLVIVIEVERTERKKVDARQVGFEVMCAITEKHGIDVDMVVLIEPAGIPKTSSGKIQRRACKALLLEDQLSEIGRWERKLESATSDVSPSFVKTAEIEQLLTKLVADMSGMPVDYIAPDKAFTSLGLNSVKLVQMMNELATMLDPQLQLAPIVAFEYPTIERLAVYLSSVLDKKNHATQTLNRKNTPEQAALRNAADHAAAYPAVAIIGMSCRFPGADTPEEFWNLIKAGRCSVGEISAERVKLTGFESKADSAYRFGGFLSNIDQFDAGVFGISPREAESIDPQQRLLLEAAWQAMESANIPISRLAGSSTGVFVGLSVNDYFRMQRRAGVGQDTYSGTGSALSIAANRISYTFGLQGPSMAIDTACSSSLVAVHQACRSLANGESSLALAGGVNLVLSSDYGTIFSQAQMLSPSGRCHTFSQQADGYVRGEGCAMLVLKLLSEAERDGDPILGVIRGSAVNQDGASNGLTAPNAQAQQQVIRQALQTANLHAADIAYVETHGTGTPLGDPIEISALHQVYSVEATARMQADDVRRATPVCLGALKPNIGHLESAAGIAGILKALLVVRHGEIPPLAVAGDINEKIDLTDSRLLINRESRTWEAVPSGQIRRAGVSSFGFGGTNAHLILESYPDGIESQGKRPQSEVEHGQEISLMLSAHSKASLQAMASAYAHWIRAGETRDVNAMLQAAFLNRQQLAERLSVHAQSPQDLVQGLLDFAHTQSQSEPHASIQIQVGRARSRHKMAFVFTGQGAQFPGMGRDLYEAEPTFREFVDTCDRLLKPLLHYPVSSIMFGEHTALLNDTRYAQAALVVLELGLARLWQHYGVEPQLVSGHSVGEYAAAHVAGILSLEDCLTLVAERGRLMSLADGQGAMLSVRASEAQIRQYLQESDSDLEIAAFNSHDQLVLSGTSAAIELALSGLTTKNIAATKLAVSHAFHSRLMQTASAEFAIVLQQVQFHPAKVPVIATAASAVNELTDSAKLMESAEYWREQICQPVRFVQAAEQMAAQGIDIFLEIGPMPVLSKLLKATLSEVRVFDSMRKDQNQRVHWQRTVGALFVSGVAVVPYASAVRLDQTYLSSIHLPRYEFDRRAYWFTSQLLDTKLSNVLVQNFGNLASSNFAGEKLAIASADIHCYQTTLPNKTTEFLLDHRLREQPIFPGAGYISLFLTAAQDAMLTSVGDVKFSLKQVKFIKPLSLSAPQQVQTLLQKVSDESNTWSAKVLARAELNGVWELHASAMLIQEARDVSALATPWPSHVKLEDSMVVEMANYYQELAAQGLEYGPAFQAIQSLQLEEDTVYARLKHPDVAANTLDGNAVFAANVLDAAFQTVASLVSAKHTLVFQGLTPLPIGVTTVRVWRPAGEISFVRARLTALPTANVGSMTANHPADFLADIQIFDEQSRLVAVIDGLQVSMLAIDTLIGRPETPTLHPAQSLRVEWQIDADFFPFGKRQDDTKPWLLLPIGAQVPSDLGAVRGNDELALQAYLAASAIELPCLRHDDDGRCILDLLEENLDIISRSAGIILVLPRQTLAQDAAQICQSFCITLKRLLLRLDAEHRLPEDFSICYLTQGACHLLTDTGAGAEVNLIHAGIAAMLRSVALELQTISLLHIDMPYSPSAEDLRVLNSILRDGAWNTTETQLAVRDGLVWRPRAKLLEIPSSVPELHLKKNASYLITGGTGGLGLLLAEHLVSAGAGKLILASRRAKVSDALAAQLTCWQQQGVQIDVRAMDVGSQSDIQALLQELEHGSLPLRGIFHAAGVLRDRPLAQMETRDWQEVFQAKAKSALLLDQLSRDCELDYFVLFSSIAACFGSAAQANYAAANGILDALADRRQQQGFAANSINWGPWGVAGMASEMALANSLARQGLLALEPKAALQALSAAISSGRAQTVIAAIDWTIFPASQRQRRVISSLRNLVKVAKSNYREDLILPDAQCFAELDPDTARLEIRLALAGLIKQVLKMADGDLLDSADPAPIMLSSLGIDSLLAMELRNRVRAWANADLPAHLLIGNNTVEVVADQIYQKILLASLSQVQSTPELDAASDHEEFVL